MKTTKAIVNASYSSIFPAQVIDHYQASRVGHRSIMFQIFPSRPKVAYKYLCSLPSAQPDTRLFQPSSIGIPQIRSIVPLRRSAMFDKHKSNHRAGPGRAAGLGMTVLWVFKFPSVSTENPPPTLRETCSALDAHCRDAQGRARSGESRSAWFLCWVSSNTESEK